jgi:hypothetical protein
VRGHLTPAAGRILRRAHGLEQLLLHGVAQRQADGAVAVVRKEPVVAGLQRHARGYQQGLMPGAGYLEEDLLLPLEQDLAVVSAP